MNIGSGRTTFNVPAAAGTFAPEVLHLRPEQDRGQYDRVREASVLIEGAIPAGASVELELLRAGGNPATAADWIAGGSYNAGTLQQLAKMAGVWGVRLRAKSGGAAGALAVSVFWS